MQYQEELDGPDGRRATIEFSIKPILGDEGQVIQLLAEGRDVTERKQVEATLRELESISTMGRLAAKVAHEINNPLAGIQNSFLLVKDAIPETHPYFRYVGAIEREIGRIAGITRQLYETYRPEPEGASNASIGTIIADAVAMIQQINRSSTVTIEVDTTGSPGIVGVPAGLLRQAIYNLVQNAIDASPGERAGGGARMAGEPVVHAVRQRHGPGCAAGMREHIFEPFTTSKVGVSNSGMGLGLALVRRSLVALGGIDQGHRRRRWRRGVHGVRAAQGDGMTLEKEQKMDAARILLADDEATFLAATADLLRREGYHCDEVGDAAAALARVSEGHYDLLITDLEMPGNADLQLVRDVGERSGGLPVIILTGYPSVRSAVASIELPVAAYLTKPVSFPLLLEKVQKAVARFRSYQVMQSTEDRLRRMRQEIGDTRNVAQDGNAVDVFLALTLRNVMGSLTDLQQLSRALNNAPTAQTPCQLLNCPRGPAAAAGGEGHGRRAGGDEGRLQVEDARRPPAPPRTAAGACVTRDAHHVSRFVTVQALACPAVRS